MGRENTCLSSSSRAGVVQEPTRQVAPPEEVIVRGVRGRHQVAGGGRRRLRGGRRRQSRQRRRLGRLRVARRPPGKARAHAAGGGGLVSRWGRWWRWWRRKVLLPMLHICTYRHFYSCPIIVWLFIINLTANIIVYIPRHPLDWRRVTVLMETMTVLILLSYFFIHVFLLLWHLLRHSHKRKTWIWENCNYMFITRLLRFILSRPERTRRVWFVFAVPCAVRVSQCFVVSYSHAPLNLRCPTSPLPL